MEPQLRPLREATRLSAPTEIREARPDEHAALGELTVEAYAALPGMPDPNESENFAGYFETLRAVAARASQPGVVILVAVNADDELLGGVTFCEDMKSYGAPAGNTGGEAAGIRMLAIHERARGLGLGRALTEECLRRARSLGRAQAVLHTTEAMPIARGMYDRMGFRRAPELDFFPDGFPIRGFRLDL